MENNTEVQSYFYHFRVAFFIVNNLSFSIGSVELAHSIEQISYINYLNGYDASRSNMQCDILFWDWLDRIHCIESQ